MYSIRPTSASDSAQSQPLFQQGPSRSRPSSVRSHTGGGGAPAPRGMSPHATLDDADDDTTAIIAGLIRATDDDGNGDGPMGALPSPSSAGAPRRPSSSESSPLFVVGDRRRSAQQRRESGRKASAPNNSSGAIAALNPNAVLWFVTRFTQTTPSPTDVKMYNGAANLRRTPQQQQETDLPSLRSSPVGTLDSVAAAAAQPPSPPIVASVASVCYYAMPLAVFHARDTVAAMDADECVVRGSGRVADAESHRSGVVASTAHDRNADDNDDDGDAKSDSDRAASPRPEEIAQPPSETDDANGDDSPGGRAAAASTSPSRVVTAYAPPSSKRMIRLSGGLYQPLRSAVHEGRRRQKVGGDVSHREKICMTELRKIFDVLAPPPPPLPPPPAPLMIPKGRAASSNLRRASRASLQPTDAGLATTTTRATAGSAPSPLTPLVIPPTGDGIGRSEIVLEGSVSSNAMLQSSQPGSTTMKPVLSGVDLFATSGSAMDRNPAQTHHNDNHNNDRGGNGERALGNGQRNNPTATSGVAMPTTAVAGRSGGAARDATANAANATTVHLGGSPIATTTKRRPPNALTTPKGPLVVRPPSSGAPPQQRGAAGVAIPTPRQQGGLVEAPSAAHGATSAHRLTNVGGVPTAQLPPATPSSRGPAAHAPSQFVYVEGLGNVRMPREHIVLSPPPVPHEPSVSRRRGDTPTNDGAPPAAATVPADGAPTASKPTAAEQRDDAAAAAIVSGSSTAPASPRAGLTTSSSGRRDDQIATALHEFHLEVIDASQRIGTPVPTGSSSNGGGPDDGVGGGPRAVSPSRAAVAAAANAPIVPGGTLVFPFELESRTLPRITTGLNGESRVTTVIVVAEHDAVAGHAMDAAHRGAPPDHHQGNDGDKLVTLADIATAKQRRVQQAASLQRLVQTTHIGGAYTARGARGSAGAIAPRAAEGLPTIVSGASANRLSAATSSRSLVAATAPMRSRDNSRDHLAASNSGAAMVIGVSTTMAQPPAPVMSKAALRQAEVERDRAFAALFPDFPVHDDRLKGVAKKATGRGSRGGI